MSERKFNTDLAERVLAQIKDHPETWNQDDYAIQTDCGTAYCVAGWASVMTGATCDMWSDFTRDGNWVDPEQDGARALGLDPYGSRASALFDAYNDLDAIEAHVKHYANNPDDDSLPPAVSS